MSCNVLHIHCTQRTENRLTLGSDGTCFCLQVCEHSTLTDTEIDTDIDILSNGKFYYHNLTDQICLSNPSFIIV